jgi:predicted transcriptional regulator
MATIISRSDFHKPESGGMNGEDIRLSELLSTIGIGDNVSQVLMFMNENDWVDSPTLQSYCGLRQPEVSVAVKNLTDRGCIEIRSERLGTRGRPRHLYRLKGSLTEVIEPWIDNARVRMLEIESTLEMIEEASAAIRAGFNLP